MYVGREPNHKVIAKFTRTSGNRKDEGIPNPERISALYYPIDFAQMNGTLQDPITAFNAIGQRRKKVKFGKKLPDVFDQPGPIIPE